MMFLFQRVHAGRGHQDDVGLFTGTQVFLESTRRVHGEVEFVSGLLRKIGADFTERLLHGAAHEQLQLRRICRHACENQSGGEKKRLQHDDLLKRLMSRDDGIDARRFELRPGGRAGHERKKGARGVYIRGAGKNARLIELRLL